MSWQTLESTLYLFDERDKTGEMYEIDGVAKEMCLALVSTDYNSHKEIADLISNKYNVDVEQVLADLEEYVNSLLKTGLIERITDV